MLIMWGAIAGQSVRETPASANPEESDFFLYVAIAERVVDGESYYEAAVKEQELRGYPVSPASTIRTPTTTLLVTSLGPKVAFGVMLTLISIVLIMSIVAFERISQTRMQWWASILLLAAAISLFAQSAVYFQETWALLFMYLSLHTRKRSATLAIGFAVLAFAFRELALPFLFAMALFEFINRNKKTAFGWVAAAAMCLGSYLFHVAAVNRAVEAFGIGTVIESDGWFALGGWPFIVGSVRSVTALSALPLWVSVLIVPLSLLGWSMLKSETGARFTFAILGFVLPFLFIGRPNNNYWGLLYAALLLPGLAFSWPALKSLVLSATRALKPLARDAGPEDSA